MSARRIGETDQRRALSFTFDGMPYEGLEGDTIASALIANGVKVIGRSFKYHRPRGIYGAGVEEPNGLVDVRDGATFSPNARVTTVLLQDGMVITAGNAMPTAARDRHGFIDRFHRFIPAGFYYKTFLWPNWHTYEPRIRDMAGLGHLDPMIEPKADSAQMNAFADVLVVGAGPAGLAAARAAAKSGRRVILVDDQALPGGSLLHRDVEIDGVAGATWAAQAVADVSSLGGRVLLKSTAYGIYDHNLVCVWEARDGAPDRLWRIRAGEVIIATGAIERPLVFPDNDRPGVMSAEAALVYLKRYGLLVGERIVIATNNDAPYDIASALIAAGAKVVIADIRDRASAVCARAEVRYGAKITSVEGRAGITAVSINGERVEADCLLVSGGYTPTVHLYMQAKGKLRYDETSVALVPDRKLDGITVVGSASGTFGLACAMAEGDLAGGGKGDQPGITGAATYTIEPAWPKPGAKGRQWIDFQNDVTVKDIELAARENYRSVEHLKRYTTLGMATDQGKTSNFNGLATMAAITGASIEATGTTTYRPPFVPAPLKIIAGRRRGELAAPVKRLVLEPQHRASGAVFREYGGWLRPAWYGTGGVDEIAREARVSRESVGLLDGSPLGKIEVFGPKAGAVMDFNSYTVLSTLKPGRIRYGFMLTETGFIYDDGVVSKLADDHYIVSCSSGHVAGVMLRLEEWRQDRFDPAEVTIHNSTPQWATLTVTGPKSRAVVTALWLGVNLSDAVLPHMAFATGVFAGRPARVARVSFTGDRSYEVSVPSSVAPALYKRMAALVQEMGGCLLGSEALLLLRAEKGYIIAGKDTDGATMPQDLGLTGPMLKRQDEYVGKRSLFSENAQRTDRNQFVGLESVDGTVLPTGAHGVDTSGGKRRSIGYVTSSYMSPILGRPMALGLIERGLSRMGEEIDLYHLGRSLKARISAPCAFDPQGSRLNAD